MDTHISQETFRQPACKPGSEKLTTDIFLKPLDTERILQREERLHQITQVMDRLTKVERQNQKVMVLIFALTISVFVFLLMETTLFPQSELLQLSQSISVRPPAAGDVQAGPRTDTPVAGAVAGKYVGVKTSNEYHLPDCKAAKTGAPEALTTFKSAAEANRQGYKPCPVCQPPKAD